MKVLIVGSGGREHALAWRIAQSPRLTGLWLASGNSGAAELGVNLDVAPEDLDGIEAAARALSIDFVVVGPELPLAGGIVDRLTGLGVPSFGPTRAAARLEASKSFAREVMQEAGVPGPEFKVFHQQQPALDFLKAHGRPVVVKADGLAAGKGVVLCPTPEAAAEAVRSCMSDRAFGDAGATIVIEELLAGVELSVFAFTDGETVSPLVAACDYKTIGDGDQGANTGGMGSFTPPGFWNDALCHEVERHVMVPVVRELARRGIRYRGVLYAGLMLTPDGLRALEFNCRFGDPEAQVILPLLASDPLDVMPACSEDRLSRAPVEWRRQAYVGVVMASRGYPGAYETGFEITGLDQERPESLIFHAGARLVAEGSRTRVVTSGGRVVTVVGRGDSVAEARARAYRRVEEVEFRGAYYRKDIALEGSREASWAQTPTSRPG